MGMFDYVKCKYPLPDGFTGECQTKDLEREMDVYTITDDGRLTCSYVKEREPVPESEWKYGGSDDPLHKIWHEASKHRNVYAERDVNFHGVLNFYGSEIVGYDPAPPGPEWDLFRQQGVARRDWHEYNAKFTDGRLVEIIQVKEVA